MEKIPTRHKAKKQKVLPNAKPKTAKKRKCDGPTCSMFLAELTRKLAYKKKQEDEERSESPRNIVQTIIDSITNALPVRFSKKSPPKSATPVKIETLQIYAPELLPNDTLSIPPLSINDEDNENVSFQGLDEISNEPGGFKIPKMPVSSEIFKLAQEKVKKEPMQDEAVNTGPDHDVASEITKHVNTLKKISLIAEEFNQKTAKNLREIVDSVQEDLIKKLEEIREQKALAATTLPIEEVLIIEKPESHNLS